MNRNRFISSSRPHLGAQLLSFERQESKMDGKIRATQTHARHELAQITPKGSTSNEGPPQHGRPGHPEGPCPFGARVVCVYLRLLLVKNNRHLWRRNSSTVQLTVGAVQREEKRKKQQSSSGAGAASRDNLNFELIYLLHAKWSSQEG